MSVIKNSAKLHSYGNGIYQRKEGSDVQVVRGKVSTTGTTTSCIIEDLSGFGDDFFNGYHLKVVGSPTAITAMSTGVVTDYVSATGTFTTTTMDGVFTEADDVMFSVQPFAETSPTYAVGDGTYVTTAPAPRKSGTPADMDTGDIFSTDGPVEILDLYGIVTTVIETQANDTKLVFDPDDGGASTDLCTVLDISATATGVVLRITKDVSEALIAFTDVAEATDIQAPSLILSQAGDIELNMAAENTGVIMWYCRWRPIANSKLTAVTS